MKSRGDRLEHRAVVDERAHQGALLHRPFRPTEVRRFGEGHSGRMPVVDNQNNCFICFNFKDHPSAIGSTLDRKTARGFSCLLSVK